MPKWTLKEIDRHLTKNNKDTYSMMVPLAAIYKKLYGRFPHFGMSGAQAEFAEQVLEKLPDAIPKGESCGN